MSAINFVGRLGKDPDSKYTPDGKMVTKFSVAEDQGYGEKKTTAWYNCSVWGEKPSENVKRILTKGSQVYINGVLTIREWNDKEGKKHVNHDVRVNDWKAVGKKNAETPEDTPFDPEG